MPTEDGTAFLVDSMGAEPVVLDEEDLKKIRQYLYVKHSANDETAEAIDWLLYLSIERDGNKHKGMDDHYILKSMVHHYMSDRERDSDSGVLVGRFMDAKPCCLSEGELEILEDTLSAIRTKSWFADWLVLQVEAIANATHPGDRYPSPLRIASTLTLCVQEHEDKMEAAREMARMRPDLLFPTPAQPTPEPPQPAAAQSAKAQRARRTRKKVKHA